MVVELTSKQYILRTISKGNWKGKEKTGPQTRREFEVLVFTAEGSLCFSLSKHVTRSVPFDCFPGGGRNGKVRMETLFNFCLDVLFFWLEGKGKVEKERGKAKGGLWFSFSVLALLGTFEAPVFGGYFIFFVSCR